LGKEPYRNVKCFPNPIEMSSIFSHKRKNPEPHEIPTIDKSIRLIGTDEVGVLDI
jgi:hypothetical protein